MNDRLSGESPFRFSPGIDWISLLWLGEAGQGYGFFFNLRVEVVDFPLNVDGPFQGRDNAAVGADIVQFETTLPPILEPLLADLVPAYTIRP